MLTRDASVLKFFAKRHERHASCAQVKRGSICNWHSSHDSADGSSADDKPVQYVDCAAMSSYRNKSIEKRIDTQRFLLPEIPPHTLDIPIKFRDKPRVTRQLNISPFARKGHRRPVVLNSDRRYSFSSCTLADCARSLRAEKQLNACAFLDPLEIFFSKGLFLSEPAASFRENKRMEFSVSNISRSSLA